MKKRGQFIFGLSFGVIFSIIIIIAIIAVAIYTITHFLSLSNCAQVALFYEDLQKEVDRAWNSGKYSNEFKGKIPSGIKTVCFGKFTQDSSIEDGQFKSEVFGSTRNVFLYPLEKACEGEGFSYNLKHATTENFFCENAIDGKINVRIVKQTTEALAKLLD